VAQRRDLELAFLAALAAAIPGCAGKSMLPWSAKSEPANLESLTSKSAAPKASWTDKLAIKPKVIPAEDQTSLTTKPKKLNADVFVRAARIHESRNNVVEAKVQYNKALDLEPKNVTALVSLARLHDRLQEFPEAEKLYKRAGEVDPKNALIWNDLGLCYARQKRMDEAAQTIDRAIQLAPQNGLYRNNMATVMVEAGRLDEAWTHLTATNEPAVAHFNMAVLLHKRSQNDLAAQHLQLALEANPKLDQAAQLLATLEGRAGVTEELAIETGSESPSYSISDEPAEQTLVANSSPSDLINPASRPAAGTHRMPPVVEEASPSAPQPTRLPVVPETSPDEGPQLDFPTRRISHTADPVRQPKNVIKLLGSEPLTAPIPDR
jgi:Tfp pilus assembly protein PilF